MPTQAQGYDHVLFDRHAVSVMARHITELEKAHLRKLVMPAQLESAGRFLYNQTGRGLDWRIQYKLHDVRGYNGTQRRKFTPKNLYKMAFLEDRGYEDTDSISKVEVLQSRGSEALIANLFSDFVGRLEESLTQHMGDQYYIDGEAAGNTDFWHGLNSMMGNNGTVTVTTGAQRATNNADLVMYPSDTYAGLSTELGAEGGSNESGAIWPNGNADRHFDYWSPIGVNGSSSALPGSGTTWAENAEYAIRFGISHAARNVGWMSETTTIVLARQMFIDLKNLLAVSGSNAEIQVNGNDENSLFALGFRDVIKIDGAEITTDHGCPVGQGFGWDYNSVEGRSLHGTLIEREGPEWDMDDSQHKAACNILGNLKFRSPRNFVKFFESSSGIA